MKHEPAVFTRVEWVVVVAITATMMAILIPPCQVHQAV